jgi:HD-GYP domain-containing protein (c-di-GMP phosphodiesterase class II)
VDDGDRASGVRLAEFVAALSLATDLGLGQPQAHVLRQTIIASRIASAAGFTDEQQSAVYYTSLLAWVGCVADSHELAKWFGDDRGIRAASYEIDKAGLPMMWFMLGHVGNGTPAMRRLGMVGRFLAGGSRDAANSMVTHCQAAGLLAEQLGLSELVGQALHQAFERWDGKGVPDQRAGPDLDPVIRAVQLADDAEVLLQVGGREAALEMLRARRGTEFDPELVDLVVDQPDDVFADIDDQLAWDTVLAGIDHHDPVLTEADLTRVLAVFADYADVKSPTWAGHSRGVEALAAAGAEHLGLPMADRVLTSRAAFVHDLGALGVSTGIWDKPGPLSPAERERVRTHPYLTERVLARPTRLQEIGAVAALHHERLDGSGYPRGVRADAIPITARLVAAADVLHALGERRPHRPPLPEDERAPVLREEVRAGRLDGEAVNAVLTAAGHRVRRRAELPAGLTRREVEVLERLVLGCSNKAIAAELGITPRTVGSHVEHIYAKIGVSTRGAAAFFAMEHGLVRR